MVPLSADQPGGGQSQFTRASGDKTDTVWINKRDVTDAARAWHDEVVIKRLRVEGINRECLGPDVKCPAVEAVMLGNADGLIRLE